MRVGEIAGEKSLVNLLEHFAEQRGHLDQRLRVGHGQLFAPRFQLHDCAIREVSDALKIGNELQAGEQLAGLGFAYARDRSGKLFVNFSLDLIEFFFAILDGKKRQTRSFGKQVAHIENRVARDETGAQYQSRELIFRQFGGDRGESRPRFIFESSSRLSS